MCATWLILINISSYLRLKEQFMQLYVCQSISTYVVYKLCIPGFLIKIPSHNLIMEWLSCCCFPSLLLHCSVRQILNSCQTAKNDWILDFQVSMELSHRYASGGSIFFFFVAEGHHWEPNGLPKPSAGVRMNF